MKLENRNQDCWEHCPRFQDARARDDKKNSLALSGFMMNPSLGISAGKLNHLEEQAVREATVGCPGPEITREPNDGFLHRALRLGPEETEVFICQTPDAKK